MNYNILENIAVCIKSKSATVGSGTYYIDEEDNNVVYVFTAAHIFYEEEILRDEIEVHIKSGNEFVDISICKDNIIIHPKYKYDEVRERSLFDCAVIKVCDKKVEKLQVYKFIFDSVSQSENHVFRGFPDKTESKDFTLNGSWISSITQNPPGKEEGRFQLRIEGLYNGLDRYEEIKGFSGAGVFKNIEEEDRLYFEGVISHCEGNDCDRNEINGYDHSLIIEIFELMKWRKPIIKEDIQSDFKDSLNSFVSRISSETIQNKIKILGLNLINNDCMSPQLYSKNLQIDNIFEQCKSHSPGLCACRWEACLVSLLTLKILGSDIKIHGPQFISSDKLKVFPVEFICSEGDGTSVIQSVVRSIVREKTMKKKQLKTYSLIIWGSNEVPYEKTLSRKELERVIVDISDKKRIEEIERNKIDIFEGNMSSHSHGIIHVHRLMEIINQKQDVINGIEDPLKLISRLISEEFDKCMS